MEITASATFLFSVLSSLIGIVIWSLSYFASKAEVRELKEEVDDYRDRLDTIAEDVAFIRGKLEGE